MKNGEGLVFFHHVIDLRSIIYDMGGGGGGGGVCGPTANKFKNWPTKLCRSSESLN